jgi:DnaD/phage-associated family protein
MICDHGMKGYGMFWIVVENLREQGQYKLKHEKSTWKALSMQMQCTTEEVKKFIEDCIYEYALFEMAEDLYFYSNSLNRRMDKYQDIKSKRVEAANKRWGNTSNIQTECKPNANALQNDAKEMKLNEMKGNENKTTNNEQQFKNLISVFSNNIHMITPFEFESLKNWSEDIEPEAIEIAVNQAVKNGVRTLKYIEGILKKWQGAGVKTKQDAEAQIRDFEDKKNGKQPEQQQTKRENPQLQAEIDAAQYYIGMQYKQFLETDPTEPQKTEYLNSFQYPSEVLKGALDKLGLVEYYIGG